MYILFVSFFFDNLLSEKRFRIFESEVSQFYVVKRSDDRRTLYLLSQTNQLKNKFLQLVALEAIAFQNEMTENKVCSVSFDLCPVDSSVCLGS